MMKRTRLSRALALVYTSGLAFASLSAAAQTTLERVSVTGSSIKRLEAETALPVTVMTRSEIQKSGAVSVEDLMHRVAAGGAMLSDSTQGAGYATSNVNMRGLGPNSTLVLLNGRRLANHPFGGIGGAAAVDLNSIPFAAIDRIEVLRDGASAVYGSDAVGGVVNFITRSDYKNGEISLRYGNTQKNIGGTEKGASFSIGFGDLETDNFNVLVTGNLQKNSRIQAKDQLYYNRGASEIKGAEPPTSGVPFPGRLMDFGINPGAFVANGTYKNPLVTACDPANTVITATGCRFIYAATLDNMPDQDKGDLFARATFNLSKEHQAYVEASYATNHSIGRVAPSPIRSDFGHLNLETGEYPSFAMPVSSKYFPADLITQLGKPMPAPGSVTEIAMRMVPMGNRINDNRNTQMRAVAGIKGLISGWDYDTAVTLAQSKGHLEYDGYFEQAKLQKAFLTGKVNPFGPQDAEGLAELNKARLVGPMRESTNTVTTWDGKASRELSQMSGGMMALAVGFDLRREAADDKPLNDDYRQGLHVGGEGSVPPTKASRTVAALYSELSLPFAKDWEANVAARYDRYSDFGSTFNPRASLRWQPMKELMLRTSAGTGFRAPSLWDANSPPAFTNTANSATDPQCPDPENEPPQCGTQYNMLLTSSKNLKAETSRQFSFGIVVEPIKALTASLDYWSISKSDQIGQIQGDTVLSNPQLYKEYGSRVHRAKNGYITYIDTPLENLGGLRTSGLDFSVRGSWNVASVGRVTVSTDGTYVLNYEDQAGKSQAYVSYAGTAGDGGRVQPVPRFQNTLAFDLQGDGWGVRLENLFVRGWYEPQGLVRAALSCGSCTDHQVKDSSRWNLSGSYSGIKGVTLRLGVRNLLDKEPPYTAVASNGSHAVGYSASFNDPRGRFFYGSIGYQFK